MASADTRTLIQQAVPREMLGRVFGLVATAAFGGSTLAYAAGGPLLDLTSPRSVFLMAGAGILAVTAFLWFALRGAASPDHRRGGLETIPPQSGCQSGSSSALSGNT